MEEMFLRFYDQSESKIDECIEKIKQVNNKITRIKKKPLMQSCNFYLPPGNHTQVWLYFDTEDDLNEAYNDVRIQKIYNEYASGEKMPLGEFQKRKKIDLGWNFEDK